VNARAGRPVRLVCSDLDGTLVGNIESTRHFRILWESLVRDRRPLLCYSSGRLIDDNLALLEEVGLPRPDYIIGGVGTQVHEVRQGRIIEEYDAVLGRAWDEKIVEEVVAAIPGIERQPERYLHRYKSSWYLGDAREDVLDELRRQLAERGVEASIVYSSSRDLDILPVSADKGNALAWLCARLDVPLDAVVVAGDTGNDSSMFRLPGVRGIVVGNAQPELFEAVVGLPSYTAQKVMAAGVIEGLVHYGVIPEIPSLDTMTERRGLDPTMRMLFDGALVDPLTADECDLVLTGFDRAVDAIRRNITPLGFSAASLEDNEVIGTDVNYRSVWGRDGAITIIGTLGLDDPEIRAAQRQTIRTLFDNITPNGMLPANVRIDSGEPDYSGVGGIAAIDSSIWMVIAFYNYVRTSGDRALLHEYAGALDRAMQWLQAQDTNNDGLLEIPEAGDWTDLFGRSYNVLYDEVLWYRASVCYGLTLEMLGDLDSAAASLRRSQQIRSRILQMFWPTTRRESDHTPVTFADRQYSIGDASYLLAEITPFEFSWRCDVFGNVLAFLMSLLDVERARSAFRYMWGVGVNDPFPVANLYPPVQSGDPDWKSYYTVNMLNLPQHYHNGGIWPLVGGMWVRYIHRLGLAPVAEHELVSLARLCRLGRFEEWEFTEWAHGGTGRPMGKRYQAWSAASYIHACHELGIVRGERGPSR
jgi:sucrose-6F-phosphate phosphohydrolase